MNDDATTTDDAETAAKVLALQADIVELFGQLQKVFENKDRDIDRLKVVHEEVAAIARRVPGPARAADVFCHINNAIVATTNDSKETLVGQIYDKASEIEKFGYKYGLPPRLLAVQSQQPPRAVIQDVRSFG